MAKNQQNLWFLPKNAVLRKKSPYIIYCFETPDLRLAAEGDTADRLTVVPAVEVRGVDVAWVEGQVVGVGATTTDRGPVVADVACEVQAVAWADDAAPDKHQRRLHNSIRISWGLGDEVGEATVCGGVASGEGEAFQKNNIFDRLLRMEDGWLDYLW